jgi:hypothetical protein
VTFRERAAPERRLRLRVGRDLVEDRMHNFFLETEPATTSSRS